MRLPSFFHHPDWPIIAWLTVLLASVVVPVVALGTIIGSQVDSQVMISASPVLALGLMSAGMIGAAAAGRMWIGVAFGLANGLLLLIFAIFSGVAVYANPLLLVVVMIFASLSFAVRGALFVCSAARKGWLVAVFVVGGEAAILITSIMMPGALPDWVLVLLPAQWASMAFQLIFAGENLKDVIPVLIALSGTALATFIVIWLWPRRWTYSIMFTTWLSASALVWYWPAIAG